MKMYLKTEDKEVRQKIVENMAVLMIKSKELVEMSASEVKTTDSFGQIFLNLLNHELRGNC